MANNECEPAHYVIAISAAVVLGGLVGAFIVMAASPVPTDAELNLATAFGCLAGVGFVGLAVGAYVLNGKKEKAFQSDPAGGVTSELMAHLRVHHISQDENPLAVTWCYYENPVRGCPSDVAVLTYRRLLIVNQSGAKTIIDLSNIAEIRLCGVTYTDSSRSQWTTNGLWITTSYGQTKCLGARHNKTFQELAQKLQALIDRRSASRANAGIGGELEKLSELVSRGVLDRQDFDRAKGLFLGRPITKQQETLQMLESLYALHRQGVLTESEFNLKKWDILSKH